MTRLGLFGGTFDPIHRGHLDVANAARIALNLTAVWLIPAQVPPHRRAPFASAAHRFAMVALACEAHPELFVSDIEMQDQAPSYTATTLDRLSALGFDTTTQYLITGADAFRDIGTWKDYPGILDRCSFVVVSRPGQSALELQRQLPELAPRMTATSAPPPVGPAILLVDAPTAPVSSTAVRDRVRAGAPIEDLVSPAVAAYIEKYGLYGASKDHE